MNFRIRYKLRFLFLHKGLQMHDYMSFLALVTRGVTGAAPTLECSRSHAPSLWWAGGGRNERQRGSGRSGAH
jgi:hypothetical protein